jgi:hypothetical protein
MLMPTREPEDEATEMSTEVDLLDDIERAPVERLHIEPTPKL